MRVHARYKFRLRLVQSLPHPEEPRFCGCSRGIKGRGKLEMIGFRALGILTAVFPERKYLQGIAVPIVVTAVLFPVNKTYISP
jgi:hypothetical protein